MSENLEIHPDEETSKQKSTKTLDRYNQALKNTTYALAASAITVALFLIGTLGIFQQNISYLAFIYILGAITSFTLTGLATQAKQISNRNDFDQPTKLTIAHILGTVGVVISVLSFIPIIFILMGYQTTLLHIA